MRPERQHTAADRAWSDAGVCRSSRVAVVSQARRDPPVPRALGNRLPAHGAPEASLAGSGTDKSALARPETPGCAALAQIVLGATRARVTA